VFQKQLIIVVALHRQILLWQRTLAKVIFQKWLKIYQRWICSESSFLPLNNQFPIYVPNTIPVHFTDKDESETFSFNVYTLLQKQSIYFVFLLF
jgi:hypothetical protein